MHVTGGTAELRSNNGDEEQEDGDAASDEADAGGGRRRRSRRAGSTASAGIASTSPTPPPPLYGSLASTTSFLLHWSVLFVSLLISVELFGSFVQCHRRRVRAMRSRCWTLR
jgi:hypothetical protein